MIRFFDEDEDGEITRARDLLYPRCENCTEELAGSSHVYWNFGSQSYEYNCTRNAADYIERHRKIGGIVHVVER